MNNPIQKKEEVVKDQKRVIVETLTRNLVQKIIPAPIPQPGNEEIVSRTQEPVNWANIDKRKYLLSVKIGDKDFSNLNGDFLGRPYLRLSSYQHNTFSAILNDPDGSVIASLNGQLQVTVDVGFAPGNGITPITVEKFKGKLYSYGPKKPDGCQIVAVDESFALQSQVAPGIATTSQESTPAAPPRDEISQMKVTSTFTGEASFYGGGDGFDGRPTANGEKFDATKLTAAHKTLSFGTMVRVTNTRNNKSVIVRINDRGPYAKNRVIDLSRAAAQAIDMVSSGVAPIRAEVLGKGSVPNPRPQADPTIQKMVDDKAKATSSPGKTSQTTLESIAKSAGKEVTASTTSASTKSGEVKLQQSDLSKAVNDARIQGDVVVTRGDAIAQIAPGQGEPSALILDYKSVRESFISASLTKMTGLQLQSGFGQTTVVGWNINNKETVAATVVTPLEAPAHPTGNITVPAWGQVKLKDPIIPGGVYTWADATHNGTRVPTPDIMRRIIALAQVIEKMTIETVGKGKRWQINSWYRDPINNRRVGGAKNSRHLYGDAVDAVFPGNLSTFYDKLNPSWNGGLARSFKSGFVHIDLGSRRRWNY